MFHNGLRTGNVQIFEERILKNTGLKVLLPIELEIKKIQKFVRRVLLHNKWYTVPVTSGRKKFESKEVQ